MPDDTCYQAVEISGTSCRPTGVHVCEDGLVRLYLNGMPVELFEAVPGGLEALACGFLLCEGIIPSASAIESVVVKRGRIDVKAGGGATPPLIQGPAPVVEARVLFESYMSLGRFSPLGRNTGGTHSAVIFTAEGGAVASGEDVHGTGAVCRAIGRAALDGRDLRGCFLLFTGSPTAWTARATSRVGLRLAVGCEAPSSKAIALARGSGMGLVAILAPWHMVIYSGQGSITGLPGQAGPG